MQILIPTRGRTSQQLTLQSLPRELLKRTTLVCPEEEAVPLACCWEDIDIVVEPYPNMKIAQTREWIVQTWYRAGYEKITMLDDDLVFATRIRADDWHLRPITGEELIPEFARVEERLGPTCPHVGFGQRQGNNFEDGDWKWPAKMCWTLAYYLPIVAKEARFDLGELELREDYSVSLQLLKKGYPNAVWTGTVADDQNGHNAPGGCSTYRTSEMDDAEALKFEALFSDYVTLNRKHGRLEPDRQQWKKALKHGEAKRTLNTDALPRGSVG